MDYTLKYLKREGEENFDEKSNSLTSELADEREHQRKTRVLCGERTRFIMRDIYSNLKQILLLNYLLISEDIF